MAGRARHLGGDSLQRSVSGRLPSQRLSPPSRCPCQMSRLFVLIKLVSTSSELDQRGLCSHPSWNIAVVHPTRRRELATHRPTDHSLHTIAVNSLHSLHAIASVDSERRRPR